MSQVWIVTGAARGIGRAIVNAALTAGHSVVATVRGATSSTSLPNDDRLLTLTLDVSTPEESAYLAVVDGR